MKKIYIAFFLITEIFLLSSCSGRTQVIDFEYSESRSVPVIEVIMSGMEFTFVFDTGAQGSMIYPTGMRKRFSNEFIKRISSDIPENRKLVAKIRNINIGENFYFRKIFEVKTSINADAEKEFDYKDGLLSYNFFHDPNNILIDYENKKIEVNTKKTLARNNVINFYTDNDLIIFPFYVNSLEKRAILDTGFDTEHKLKVITPEILEDGSDSLNIRIGNIEYANVEAKYYKKATFATTDTDSLDYFLQKYYIISNAFFSDGKIEIDFKNKQLIIAK